MKSPAPAPADLQRWSEDVARDPASLAFVPLARAYRKQGRRDAALKLCLRGLEHHPANVDAHALLALLYFESGQRALAYDEWATVLRLEPEHFEALRGLGFYHLEREDDDAAMRSLERAARIRPNDVTVQEAIRLIRERRQPTQPLEVMPWEEQGPWTTPAVAPGPAPEPVSNGVFAGPTISPARAGKGVESPVLLQEVQARPVSVLTVDARTQSIPDPAQLFQPVLGRGQMLGALLIDAQGFVLAGALVRAPATKAQTLGAILGGTIEEAVRTSTYLAMGSWRSILLDAEHALIYLAPVREGAILLLAALRETPPGWMLRSAHQAAMIAERFLETNP